LSSFEIDDDGAHSMRLRAGLLLQKPCCQVTEE